MATTGHTPCDDASFRQYFQQVFGRPPEGDSELDRYVIAWLITALDDATAGQPITPARAGRGVAVERS